MTRSTGELGEAKLLNSNYSPEMEGKKVTVMEKGDAFVTLEGYEGRIYLVDWHCGALAFESVTYLLWFEPATDLKQSLGV